MNEKINFKIILKLLSFIFFIEACAFSFCIPVAIIYNEPVRPFILSILVAIFPSIIFRFLARSKTKDEIQNHEALFSVVFGWFIMILLGILPYIFSGGIPHFVNVYWSIGIAHLLCFVYACFLEVLGRNNLLNKIQ